MEEAAAAVDGEEQALHEDRRGTAIAVISMGTVFLLLGTALLGLRGLGPTEQHLLGRFATVSGLGMAGWGFFVLRRRPAPFLLLRRDDLVLPGLDRPIAWAHILDLDMTLDRGRVSTRRLLPSEAPFPAPEPGRRRVKLDAKQRIVTITAGLPCGMKAQGFADLIGRYRMADAARRELAAGTAHDPEFSCEKE